MNRLKEKYQTEIVSSLTEKFNYSSVMLCQRLKRLL